MTTDDVWCLLFYLCPHLYLCISPRTFLLHVSIGAFREKKLVGGLSHHHRCLRLLPSVQSTMATLDQLLLAAGSGDQGQQEGMVSLSLFIRFGFVQGCGG